MGRRRPKKAEFPKRHVSGNSDPNMEKDPVKVRQTIHSIIMSTEDYDDAGQKLLNILKQHPSEDMSLCRMLIKCCSEDRTYLQYYGLLGQRICMNHCILESNFERCFGKQYLKIDRLEENNLINLAKFYAHLLSADAISWRVLSYLSLTEEEITDSCRIFVTVLFQELSEILGIRLLNQRLMQSPDSAGTVLRMDDPRNTKFAIDFFISIGLGGITENLQNYLKMNQPQVASFIGSESDEEERKKRRRT